MGDGMRRLQRVLPLLFALTVSAAANAQDPPLSAAIVGGTATYSVRTGDTLGRIAARFGVTEAALIEANRFVRPYPLVAGQSITIDNRHIALYDPVATITLNLAQRLLVHADGERLTSYPIAVGRRTWPTPTGAFTVTEKERDPAWDVPVSIQREMAQQGKPVITRMAPSPENPLGARWIRLSFPSVGIHGTNAPGSIYRFTTHGCIRMHPDDVADLFERVSVGTAGVSLYQPVIVAVIDGRIWLEAHPDEYRRAPDAARYVRDLIQRLGLGASVDWTAIDRVLRLRRGRAVDVTRPD
jgi:L,D-transpeptidase ErfK/SrfK